LKQTEETFAIRKAGIFCHRRNPLFSTLFKKQRRSFRPGDRDQGLPARGERPGMRVKAKINSLLHCLF